MTNCDFVPVTLYDSSNDTVAKRSSHWCQLILVVEDVKLDKPNFLFQSSDRNRQSLLPVVRLN